MATLSLRQRALYLLANREHSRLELFNKLKQRDFSVEEINITLDELEQEKLLSDERFVEMYINARSQRGYGPERIRQELQQKGVAASLVECYLDIKATDWFDLARELKQKKFGAALPKDFPTRAKQMRFLQYRGFTLEQINNMFKISPEIEK